MSWQVVKGVEVAAFELRPARGVGINWQKRRENKCPVLSCAFFKEGKIRPGDPSMVSKERGLAEGRLQRRVRAHRPCILSWAPQKAVEVF